MVGQTAIVSAYAYGKYLGELNVTFDDDGNVTAAEGVPVLIDASVEEDAATHNTPKPVPVGGGSISAISLSLVDL